jgi:hypothetical protein
MLTMLMLTVLGSRDFPAAPALALTPTVSPRTAPLSLENPVADKNFYLFHLISQSPAVQMALAQDPEIRKIQQDLASRFAAATANESFDQGSSLRKLLMTSEEIDRVSDALRRLYQTNREVAALADVQIPESGCYYRYQSQSGADRLASAFRDCLTGVNHVIEVYGLGVPGRSSATDSMFYKPTDLTFNGTIHQWFGTYAELNPNSAPFYEPSLRLATWLLDLNMRDEAGRFEPMERGENRAAYRRVRSVDWRKYPYSVILVPGLGPEEPEVRLSPAGKLLCQLAAKRYRDGQAPFIITSGGFVHPRQTPYCEAIEMKRSLMRDFGVPENAILIDPHARHTTTNLRNAARLIYRYGIPFDKPGLVTTNTFQSKDIESKAFRDRCQSVFGYQPFLSGKRLSPFDTEFYPLIDSLYTDPADPLDP